MNRRFRIILDAWKVWAYKSTNDHPDTDMIKQHRAMFERLYPGEKNTPLPIMFEFFCAGFYSGKNHETIFTRLRRFFNDIIKTDR